MHVPLSNRDAITGKEGYMRKVNGREEGDTHGTLVHLFPVLFLIRRRGPLYDLCLASVDLERDRCVPVVRLLDDGDGGN